MPERLRVIHLLVESWIIVENPRSCSISSGECSANMPKIHKLGVPYETIHGFKSSPNGHSPRF